MSAADPVVKLCPQCCAETAHSEPAGTPGVSYRCPTCGVDWWEQGTPWWYRHGVAVCGVLAGATLLLGLVVSPWWAVAAAGVLLAPAVPGFVRSVRGVR